MSTVTDKMFKKAKDDRRWLFSQFQAACATLRERSSYRRGPFLVDESDLPIASSGTQSEQPAIPEGFIPWHGGECPVASGTVVECTLMHGEINCPMVAINMRWSHIGSPGDIIAYRIHKPADFRLEAGKFYVTASGERVGPMRHSSGAYGSTYHDSDDWGRWWWPDGEIGLLRSREPDILALSSNQEKNMTEDELIKKAANTSGRSGPPCSLPPY
jgi:hypothetical protein